MKIFTSYFGQLRNLKKEDIIPVNIARYRPRYFAGRSIMALAPHSKMLGMSEADYDKEFDKILRGIDPRQIIKILEEIGEGKDVALLCYEKPELRCHRQTVAKWLEKHLSIKVEEWDPALKIVDQQTRELEQNLQDHGTTGRKNKKEKGHDPAGTNKLF